MSVIFGVFSNGFLHRTILNVVVESIFAYFFGILIFDPNRQFCKGYSLSKMTDFQDGLISGIFGAFYGGFNGQRYNWQALLLILVRPIYR